MQPVFFDPIVVSNVADLSNVGDGILTVTQLTHFTISQVYTVTCIQLVPNPTFAVVGSLDGSVGLATQGVSFVDQDIKFRFIITGGATPFAIGDKFTVTVQQGTDLNEANINTYDELPQKNFSEDNDDNLRYDNTTKEFSFNSDEVTDPLNFFEGNALVRARDFLTHGAAAYPHAAVSSLKETSDETLFRKLLKITPNEPADTAVDVAGASIARADGTVLSLTDSEGVRIQFAGGSIDFATGTGTNVNAFTPVNLDPSEYVIYGISLNNDSPNKHLEITSGVPNVVLASATYPQLPKDFVSIGYIIVQDDGTGGVGTIEVIEAEHIEQLTITSAGPSTDTGLIQEIMSLRYAAGILDDLTDSSAFEPTETTASFGSSGYSISYDNKTIVVVGNNVTLGSAPAFTISEGDLVVQNNKAIKIVTVTSQTDFDVEDGSVLTSGNNAILSQCAETIDLTEYGEADYRTSDYYTTSIEHALLWYEDEVFQDTAVPVPVAAVLSTNLGSYWSDVYTRPNDFADEHEAIELLFAGPHVTIRFFANIGIGSGTVRLDNYRIYFHERTVQGAVVGTSLVSVQTAETIPVTMENDSGTPIQPFKVVRPDYTNTGKMVLADKSGYATGRGVGITIELVGDGNTTPICTAGVISGANLVLGFNEGEELFLGSNGDITNVAPSVSGEYVLRVGEVSGNDLIVAMERRGLI